MCNQLLDQINKTIDVKLNAEKYISENYTSIDLDNLLKMSKILTPQKRSGFVKSKIKEYLPNDEIVVVSKRPYIRQFYPSRKINHTTVVVIHNDNCDIYRISENQLIEEYTKLTSKLINRISVKEGKSVSVEPTNIGDWDKYKLPNIF
jgi:hypothetical protein